MPKIVQNLFLTIIKEAIRRKIKSPENFDELKKEICGQYGVTTPRNADIRDYYEKLVSANKIKRNCSFEKTLKSKKNRTLSGVAVVAVLTKFHPCRGKCLYCPTESEMPKSYLSNEPAVMRAMSVNFDPYKQVQKRMRALEINGHEIDKIELIVMGGTFSDLPKDYRYWFIKECYMAANRYGEKSQRRAARTGISRLKKELGREQKVNETAKNRIIGLTLETRPDALDEGEVALYRELGATRVEIGVQSIYDDVLKKNRRGHLVGQTIEATKILKNAGFKVGYHMMPGLLGSNIKKDIGMFHEIFSNPDFQPDLIKIYPCVVTRNSALYKIWKKQKYKALSNKEAEKVITEIKKNIPPYVRISRLVRDIPSTSVIAGPNISNLRQLIQNKGVKCDCIRCREIRGEYDADKRISLRRIDYDASGGKEIFLEFCSADGKKLNAMLRLRIIPSFEFAPTKKSATEPHSSAVIREVHTYGKLVSIGAKNKKSPQHAGLGKKLMKIAERIARDEFSCQEIYVISGIGAREYYRKLGYNIRDTYMVKYFQPDTKNKS